MITNSVELLARKEILKNAVRLQEAKLKADAESVKERFFPAETFLGNAWETIKSGKGETSLLRHSLSVGVPLLLDRILLGTRGIFGRQLLIYALRFAFKRVSLTLPARFDETLSGLIYPFRRNRVLSLLMRVFS